MNSETEKLLRELASKLGTTAEHLWSVLVKQAPIYGWTTIVEWTLLGMVTVALWFLWAKIHKTTRYDEEPAFIVGAMAIVCGLIFVLVPMVCGADVVACFLNPEYWALQQLIHK